jgi:hypothetical protein
MAATCGSSSWTISSSSRSGSAGAPVRRSRPAGWLRRRRPAAAAARRGRTPAQSWPAAASPGSAPASARPRKHREVAQVGKVGQALDPVVELGLHRRVVVDGERRVLAARQALRATTMARSVSSSVSATSIISAGVPNSGTTGRSIAPSARLARSSCASSQRLTSVVDRPDWPRCTRWRSIWFRARENMPCMFSSEDWARPIACAALWVAESARSSEVIARRIVEPFSTQSQAMCHLACEVRRRNSEPEAIASRNSSSARSGGPAGA